MKPIKFPQVNKTLLDNGYRSGMCKDISSLPIWTNDEMCTSLWKMTWKERISALIFGRIWVDIISGSNQPPIALSVRRDVFK